MKNALSILLFLCEFFFVTKQILGISRSFSLEGINKEDIWRSVVAGALQSCRAVARELQATHYKVSYKIFKID